MQNFDAHRIPTFARLVLTVITLSAVAIPGAEALAAKKSQGKALRVVGVAPFTSTSTSEYQWIGPAIAGALALRIHQQDELGALTLRQINAAMRHDRLRRGDLVDPDKAVQLGRQLGADVLVTGTYEARWPDIDIHLTILSPQQKRKKILSKQQLSGGLDDLLSLEAKIAEALAKALGAKQPDVSPGTFGTDNLRAWRAVTLATEVLNWQSLSPRAADPNAQLRLPEATIKDSQRQLIEATKLAPNFGEAWALLGVTQALLKDTGKAWKSFGRATSLGAGHHPTAVLGSSFVRMREGRFDDAATILRNAIGKHPGFLHARGYLGELYNHRGRHREALKAFQGYQAAVPKQPWVMTQVGYSQARLGDHRNAIANTIAAVGILPGSPSLLLQLASRYIDAKKYIGAEDALLQLTKLHPQIARGYVRLGYVYLLQGKDELAIPITEKALVQAQRGHSDRDKAYAHLNLTRAYGHLGRLEEAFHHLGEAKRIGVVSLDELSADPKLKTMQQDPRFEALLQ